MVEPPLSAQRPPHRLALLVVALCLAYLLVHFALPLALRAFVMHPYYVPSAAMKPTLQINDRIMTTPVHYRSAGPQLGDIVVFQSPSNADPEEKLNLKRVVGLPGDRLKVQAGHLWRNGQQVTEPFVAEPMFYTFPDPADAQGSVSAHGDYLYRTHFFSFPITHGEYVVPAGHVFVLGDNRNVSNDSHVWGPLPLPNLRGRAFSIFYPPARVRSLP